MITAGIWVIIASLVGIAVALALRLTRDTGTRAAPRRQRGDWDEPDPGDWLPAPEWPAPVTHEEDWRAALTEWHERLEERQASLDDWQATLEEERHSGVIVADIYHPSPPGPPGDYQWREPFAWWLSDTNVGGMLAIGAGGE